MFTIRIVWKWSWFLCYPMLHTRLDNLIIIYAAFIFLNSTMYLLLTKVSKLRVSLWYTLYIVPVFFTTSYWYSCHGCYRWNFLDQLGGCTGDPGLLLYGHMSFLWLPTHSTMGTCPLSHIPGPQREHSPCKVQGILGSFL